MTLSNEFSWKLPPPQIAESLAVRFVTLEPINRAMWRLLISMGVRMGGGNGHLPPWKLGLRTKNVYNTQVSNLILNNWLNSCNESLFAPMTRTLHKSQVHCTGVMQWWACSSLMYAHFPAEAVAKLANELFYCWPLLRNNCMAWNDHRFALSCGSRCFAACVDWLSADILVGNAVRQWLMIAVSHIVAYCVKRSMSESLTMLPQVWKMHCWCEAERDQCATASSRDGQLGSGAILR